MAGDAIKGHHPANRLKALRLSSDTGLPFSHHVVAGDAHTFIQAVAENSPKCEHHHYFCEQMDPLIFARTQNFMIHILLIMSALSAEKCHF